MSFDKLKAQTKSLPEPPRAENSTVRLDRPVSRPDGRTARATGRTKQFNPRVRPEFLERLALAQAREEERAGEKITQAYFLELLLVAYERSRGEAIRPFGLSEPAFQAAQAIAGHMGWSLSVVIEDAIAGRYRQFSLANEPKARKR
jgi:hypothetical protein